MAKSAAKQARGRPSKYTEEIGQYICDELARGRSLNAICQEPGLPDESTVRMWVIDGNKGQFSTKYARARELQAMKWAEEVLTIADDGRNDTYANEDDEGNVRVNHDHIQRSRLRVDTRKWLLSKVLPKIYGDRLTTEVTGKDGGPIQTEATTRIDASQLDAEARALLRASLTNTKGEK